MRLLSRRAAFAVTALLLVCMPALGGMPDTSSTEYRIKVAFLYNFTSFVSWPEAATGETGFTLCVLGHDPFGQLLDKLEGKPAGTASLVVRRIATPAALKECNLVFIGEMPAEQLDAALEALHALPVLTVSDIPGFTNRGGIIEFRIIANKVRFAINRQAAASAGLNISSKLLNLATNFRQDD